MITSCASTYPDSKAKWVLQKIFLPVVLGAVGFSFAIPLHAAEPGKKPNIIFILADDLGWTDTGVDGSKYYETPNINRLATQGMRLTNYHTSHNCAPTRAALMSGQYSPRTGIYNVGVGGGKGDYSQRPLIPFSSLNSLPQDKITVAQALKSGGYKTAMFGKWHLGKETDPKYHPQARGFDEALVTGGGFFNFSTVPKVVIPDGVYKTDWLTDRAEDFIHRNKDAPFFLYLPHQAPHTPLQAKPELIEKFKNKPAVGGHSNPTYAAMIYSLDESVGRIMSLLDELDLADDTLFIFSSDNGGVGGYNRPDGFIRDEGVVFTSHKGGITDNAPLRSGKGSYYEGGIRAPFIVRYPGKVRAGSKCDQPTIHVDLYPTFLEFAGVPSPASYILDGESLAPLMIGSSGALKRDAIFHFFPCYLAAGLGQWRGTPVAAVMTGDWKLMEFLEDKHLELYNLKDDLSEKINLAGTEPERAKALQERLHAWQREIKAPVLKPNTNPSKIEGVRAKKVKKKDKK
jgi:arylsulfatase A-like enzyme